MLEEILKTITQQAVLSERHIKFLIKYGINADLDGKGNSFIHRAAVAGNVAAFRQLTEAGAKDVVNADGKSAHHLAIEHDVRKILRIIGKRESLAQWQIDFLRERYDLNTNLDGKGTSFVRLAAEARNLIAFAQLVQAGASLIPGTMGANLGREDIVREILGNIIDKKPLTAEQIEFLAVSPKF